MLGEITLKEVMKTYSKIMVLMYYALCTTLYALRFMLNTLMFARFPATIVVKLFSFPLSDFREVPFDSA